MLVSQILKSKSDDGVVTMPPGTAISRVAEVLSARRFGAVVISVDGKKMDGIVSERDIVREIGRRGGACLNEPVDTIMTAKVVSCARSDNANDVLQKMTDGRFRHIPVLEAGELIGLISIGDVVKARLSELKVENDALEGMIKGY
jgi:CBS domain-containing protein